MKKDGIVAKIQKLLNMAENGTENEKAIAMVKAQKLMLDYRIEMAEVLGCETEEVVEIAMHEKINAYQEWIDSLVKVVAKNFRCVPLYMRISHTKGKLTRVIICGLEEDAKICKMILEHAFTICEKESKKVVNYYHYRGESTKGIKETFCKAFIRGVKDGYHEQLMSKNRYALAIVVPEEVNQHIAEYGRVGLNRRRTGETDNAYARGYGYQCGQEVASKAPTDDYIEQKAWID